ncbi:hypothetical protein Ddc_11580 [Ditylenchus destructor]|nr:hypothetical protein Ddc_11580 [Ditylenchus destructor]
MPTLMPQHERGKYRVLLPYSKPTRFRIKKEDSKKVKTGVVVKKQLKKLKEKGKPFFSSAKNLDNKVHPLVYS